jgi:hypothetical protein
LRGSGAPGARVGSTVGGATVAAGAAGAWVLAGAGAWVAVAGAPQAERIIDAAMINAVKTNSFLFIVSFLLVLEFGFLIRRERYYKGLSGGIHLLRVISISFRNLTATRPANDYFGGKNGCAGYMLLVNQAE